MNSFARRSLQPLLLLMQAILVLYFAAAQSASVPNAQLASKELNARVDALLKKMTLEEKLGQLTQYNIGDATGPNASNLKYE